MHIERDKEYLNIEEKAGEEEQIGCEVEEAAVGLLFGQSKPFVRLPGQAGHQVVSIGADRQLVRYSDPLVKAAIIVLRVAVLEGQVNGDQPGRVNDAL